MKIQFYRKEVYGHTMFYLKNTSDRHVYGKVEKAILELIKQKTITERQIELFKTLGLEFEEVLRNDWR